MQPRSSNHLLRMAGKLHWCIPTKPPRSSYFKYRRTSSQERVKYWTGGWWGDARGESHPCVLLLLLLLLQPRPPLPSPPLTHTQGYSQATEIKIWPPANREEHDTHISSVWAGSPMRSARCQDGLDPQLSFLSALSCRRFTPSSFVPCHFHFLHASF